MGPSLSQRSDLVGHNGQICLDRGSNGQIWLDRKFRSQAPELPVVLYKYRWERELRDWGQQLPSSFSLLSHLERKELRFPPLLFLSHGLELKSLGEIESPLWVWMRG